MSHETSWKGLRADFEECSKQYDDLFAECDSLDPGQWTLRGASPRAERKFQELGTAAAAKLGPSQATGDGKPWQLWLGYMRAAGWRYPETHSSNSDVVPPRSDRVPWPEQRRRAEAGDRILPRVFQVSADCCLDLAEREESVSNDSVAEKRAAFVKPILKTKGWSILDWANESDVDYHTANDYLTGTTTPYSSTRLKLAQGLGVDIDTLPS
jgi:hypothetical protein